MLACRNCRVALSSQDGCAICTPFKVHLVSTEESAELAPSLAEVGAESVAALRAMVRYLAKELKDDPTDGGMRKDLVLATNGVAKVLEAARKLQDDGIAAVRNMSFMERAKLMVAWYASLAPVYRTQVIDRLKQYESDLAKPNEELSLQLEGTK